MTEHFERGGASSEHGRPHPFWPWPKGSNEHKTELAAAVLDNILDNVCWGNVLMLHSYVAIYEVRNSRGFGLRWTLNLDGTIPSDLQRIATATTDDKVPTPGATGEKGVAKVEDKAAPPPPPLRISSVVFRGFVEPILNMDHELPDA